MGNWGYSPHKWSYKVITLLIAGRVPLCWDYTEYVLMIFVGARRQLDLLVGTTKKLILSYEGMATLYNAHLVPVCFWSFSGLPVCCKFPRGCRRYEPYCQSLYIVVSEPDQWHQWCFFWVGDSSSFGTLCHSRSIWFFQSANGVNKGLSNHSMITGSRMQWEQFSVFFVLLVSASRSVRATIHQMLVYTLANSLHVCSVGMAFWVIWLQDAMLLEAKMMLMLQKIWTTVLLVHKRVELIRVADKGSSVPF